ncbi:baeRF12 domain-containing protein [Gluconacetobacter takamatsuzukensis]|uniref:Attachment protein n=1 Tax=Gluconacetobacter takamatsuzukensis TaxID=1286190 RepID=A0A7W4KAU8_9PROT|nr:host attachment protein [Gluconacetobacter takamatsuzukensis]MBB2203541.1 attachment protein [Gluconacetobacter takamatsuzukensis]
MTTIDPVTYVVADAHTARLLRHEGHALHTIEHIATTEHFATTIAETLNRRVTDGTISRFILAAPGHLLHAIRAELAATTQDRLILAVPKELAQLPDHELIHHFDIPATGWP